MDSIENLLRPYVKRIFEAGKLAALESTNGDGPEFVKYLDPAAHPRDAHGHFFKVADGTAKWGVPPIKPAEVPTEPGIPLKPDSDPMSAILGAMLLHAVECAEHDENMLPGLKVLVGLVHDRAKLAKITGQKHATVEKAYWASIEKEWREELHPRDQNGRYISIGKIEAAQIDPAKAAELRKEVAPEHKENLENALGNVHPDMPKTKLGQRKIATHQKRLGKAESLSRLEVIKKKLFQHGEGKREFGIPDIHELQSLLPGMRVQDLRELRREHMSALSQNIGWKGARTQEKMAQRLNGWLHERLEKMNGPAEATAKPVSDAPPPEETPQKDEPMESPPKEPDVPSRLTDPKVNNADLDLPKGADSVNKEEPYEPFDEKPGHLIDPGETKARSPADHMLDSTVAAIHRILPRFDVDSLHHGSMSDRLHALAEFDKHAKSLLGGTKSVRDLGGFSNIAKMYDKTIKDAAEDKDRYKNKFDPEDHVQGFETDGGVGQIADALSSAGHHDLATLYSKHGQRVVDAAAEALREEIGEAPKPTAQHEMTRDEYDDEVPFARHKDDKGIAEFDREEAEKHAASMGPDVETKLNVVYHGAKRTPKLSVHHRPTHESVVREAIAAGKDVPEDATKDYPHLWKKDEEPEESTEPAPEPEKTTPPEDEPKTEPPVKIESDAEGNHRAVLHLPGGERFPGKWGTKRLTSTEHSARALREYAEHLRMKDSKQSVGSADEASKQGHATDHKIREAHKHVASHLRGHDNPEVLAEIETSGGHKRQYRIVHGMKDGKVVYNVVYDEPENGIVGNEHEGGLPSYHDASKAVGQIVERLGNRVNVLGIHDKMAKAEHDSIKEGKERDSKAKADAEKSSREALDKIQRENSEAEQHIRGSEKPTGKKASLDISTGTVNGTQIGPFLIAKSEGKKGTKNKNDHYDIHHMTSKMGAGHSYSLAEAKLMAHMLAKHGKWDFTEEQARKGLPPETLEHAHKVLGAFKAGKWADLKKHLDDKADKPSAPPVIEPKKATMPAHLRSGDLVKKFLKKPDISPKTGKFTTNDDKDITDFLEINGVSDALSIPMEKRREMMLNMIQGK